MASSCFGRASVAPLRVRDRMRRGLTLLELLTAIVILSVLAILILPVVNWAQSRAQRVACGENLKGLFTGTTAYLTSNSGVWPQIPWNRQDERAYARSWEEALRPYGLTWKNWICPTIQQRLHNPDVTAEKNHRSDYLGALFDSNPWTARKWPKQPWFLERQDVHEGNLMILADGNLIDVHEAERMAQQPQSAP